MMKSKSTGISGSAILEWILKIFCGWMLFASITTSIMSAWNLIQLKREGERVKQVFLWELREYKYAFYHLILGFILYRIILTSNPKKGRLQEFRCCLWVIIYAAFALSYDICYDFYTDLGHDDNFGPFIRISFLKCEIITFCFLTALMTLHYKYWPQETLLENENSDERKSKADAKERAALLKIDPSAKYSTAQGYQLV